MRCAANDCEEETHHPEVPFCTRHWRSLPKPHCKKMWEQRPAANDGDAGPDWDQLLKLGIAVCLVREGWRGGTGEHVDEGGFDWEVGLQDSSKLYRQAEKVCLRFPIRP